MNALNFYLKTIPQNQPFFISVYNMGTHAWLDHSKESLKYRDGANNIYNAVYSFDHAFGAFLREFKKSAFYKNTMIIVTADHCYPPLEEYIKIAGDNYAPFFVDKIPMIIYSPGQKLPKIYNPGDIRTSLDFAPTLLHLLNVPSGENHFLGRSLFEPPFTRNTFAAIGEYVLLITGKGVFAKPENREDLASMIRIKEFVYYITGLEQENRIWKPAGNK
jgi:phosphoglycerol transferase MdoB-like AlkP superfamily enzyme